MSFSPENFTVLVTGLGRSGFAAADALLQRGARVIAVDPSNSPELTDQAEILRIMGAEVSLDASELTVWPAGVELVVTSPDWPRDHPLLQAADARSIPVWGELELAWQLRPESASPWLVIAGTKGKTSTAKLLNGMLAADGRSAEVVGTPTHPALYAVVNPDPADFVVIEADHSQWGLLSSDREQSISPWASAILNIDPNLARDGAEDQQSYAQVYQQTQSVAIYNLQDPLTEELLHEAEVIAGCRAIGITLGIPAVGMVGLVDDVLADRAFLEQRQTSAIELATLADIAGEVAPRPTFQVVNALTAAALARSVGVSPAAVRAGLRAAGLNS